MSVKKMLFIAAAVSIIFVQEQMLMFLPNIQFTVLLIILFSSIFTFKESVTMILVYVLLDSLFMGAMSPFTVLPLIIGWMLIPISYHTILRRTENEYILAVFALLFGFVFGWVFIPFNMLQTGISNPIPYLIADIPFEALMAGCGFLTVIYVYKPLKQTLNQLVHGPELMPKKSNT